MPTPSFIQATRSRRSFASTIGPDLDPQADLTLLGAGGGFGSALCATDLDGDGSQDVLVGAPLVGGVTGRVYVFFGGSQFDSQADRVLASGIPAENFGCALAAAGDLDGDGFGDLVVGAVSSNYYDPGRAWIVLGGPHLDDVCDGVLDGPADANGFGQTVAAGRDVDHDGRPDVLVGSPELPAYTSYAYLFTDVHPTATDRPEPIESRPADLRAWIGLPVDRGAVGVQIEYSIGPRASEAELALFDVAGRRLRILATGPHPAGRSRVSWDRTSANGARVARGVYILRLRAGGLEAQRKLVLVRP